MYVEVRLQLQLNTVELQAVKAKLADVENQLRIRVTFDSLMFTTVFLTRHQP